ncbi:MAG: hypothetical protein AAFQ82_25475, partial [Myxococcota bacterium]
FYVGSAVTVAAVVTGSIFGLRAISKRDEFNQAVEDSSQESPADGARLQVLEDDFRDARNLSNGFFAAGALSAIATGTLYFFTDFDDEPVLSVSPIDQGVSVSTTLRF